MKKADRLVALGRIVGPHGVRGELRARIFNPQSSILSRVGEVFVLDGDRTRQFQLRGARPHKGAWLIDLQSIESCEGAEALAGRELAVRESALAPTRPGEFYHHQLLGLDVVDDAGRPLGSVREILSAGGNDVLSVGDAERERLIPMTAEVVRSIDLEARRIVVRPLPGLLDP